MFGRCLSGQWNHLSRRHWLPTGRINNNPEQAVGAEEAPKKKQVAPYESKQTTLRTLVLTYSLSSSAASLLSAANLLLWLLYLPMQCFHLMLPLAAWCVNSTVSSFSYSFSLSFSLSNSKMLQSDFFSSRKFIKTFAHLFAL